MAKVKETVGIYFGGDNIELIKGNEVSESSALFKAKPELFEVTEVKKAAPKKVTKKEELKEELLVEAPVAELEVEIKDEAVEAEEKPKRRRKK